MVVLKHQSFRATDFLITDGGTFRRREEVREDAERFANAIGAINVVSVTEELFRDQLIVTIWYRETNKSDSVGDTAEAITDE